MENKPNVPKCSTKSSNPMPNGSFDKDAILAKEMQDSMDGGQDQSEANSAKSTQDDTGAMSSSGARSDDH